MLTSASRLKIHVRPVDACPLCGVTARFETAPPLPNLYSEKLAILLHCEEVALLQRLSNVRCRRCGLIYKTHWFDADILRSLFGNAVAEHPRGWDCLGDRYRVDTFAEEIQAYADAIERGDFALMARYQRGLLSILTAMPGLPMQTLERLGAAIALGNCDALKAAIPDVSFYFAHPAAYSRFCGYADPALWQWLQSQLGDISAYAEVGCPLWGFLGRGPTQSQYYLQREEANFWGSQCRRGALHCTAALQQRSPVVVRDWSAHDDRGYDLLTMLQYLDHVEAPLSVLREACQRARAVFLALDGEGQPCAVQHLTSWSESPLQWAARELDRDLRPGFAALTAAGHYNCLMVAQ